MWTHDAWQQQHSSLYTTNVGCSCGANVSFNKYLRISKKFLFLAAKRRLLAGQLNRHFFKNKLEFFGTVLAVLLKMQSASCSTPAKTYQVALTHFVNNWGEILRGKAVDMGQKIKRSNYRQLVTSSTDDATQGGRGGRLCEHMRGGLARGVRCFWLKRILGRVSQFKSILLLIRNLWEASGLVWLGVWDGVNRWGIGWSTMLFSLKSYWFMRKNVGKLWASGLKECVKPGGLLWRIGSMNKSKSYSGDIVWTTNAFGVSVTGLVIASWYSWNFMLCPMDGKRKFERFGEDMEWNLLEYPKIFDIWNIYSFFVTVFFYLLHPTLLCTAFRYTFTWSFHPIQFNWNYR